MVSTTKRIHGVYYSPDAWCLLLNGCVVSTTQRMRGVYYPTDAWCLLPTGREARAQKTERIKIKMILFLD